MIQDLADPGWMHRPDVQWAYDAIIDCFGPARVMWGSDWPVVELNADYGSWWQAARAIVGDRPGAASIFGGTAARFYRIA